MVLIAFEMVYIMVSVDNQAQIKRLGKEKNENWTV